MRIPIDIAGQRFGQLIAVHPVKERHDDGQLRWLCHCDCGEKTVVIGSLLRRGNTKSCGHLLKQFGNTHCLRHGDARNGKRSREHTCWSHMLDRCRNPNSSCYRYYGGRGITVCERWHKFEHFLADMGRCPPGLTLERINNSGNYTPDNCKWATVSDQNRNKRKKGTA